MHSQTWFQFLVCDRWSIIQLPAVRAPAAAVVAAAPFAFAGFPECALAGSTYIYYFKLHPSSLGDREKTSMEASDSWVIIPRTIVLLTPIYNNSDKLSLLLCSVLRDEHQCLVWTRSNWYAFCVCLFVCLFVRVCICYMYVNILYICALAAASPVFSPGDWGIRLLSLWYGWWVSRASLIIQ